MAKKSGYTVLICGLLSVPAALLLYLVVYSWLTQRSEDTHADWAFRLTMSTLVMAVPFVVTLGLAVRVWKAKAFGVAAKIGMALSVVSLALTWKPIHDGLLRSRQERNLAMRNVAAPAFETTDIAGKSYRLADYRGKVVLVNIWATWCGPCRAEMPELDRLYRKDQANGLAVFGISDEDVGTQEKFLKQVSVSYPLLTLNGNVPGLYRDVAKYPAMFLIDRNGQLQPAPSPEQGIEAVEEAVRKLL